MNILKNKKDNKTDIYIKTLLMEKFSNKVDKMISKILNEEIENKVKSIVEEFEEGEWTEIDMEEELHGGQKKLDKNKNGKLDAEDFKMLRKKKKESHESEEEHNESWGAVARIAAPMAASYIMNKMDEEEGEEKELDEFYFYDEEGAEELSQNEPTYVGRGLSDNKPGKMFGSFSDEHGWFDEKDGQYKGEFDFDFDEEEFSDFDSFMEKHGKNQSWFSPKDGARFFDRYKEKYGSPFKVRMRKDMDEQETEEGNAFSGALAKAKAEGKDSFEVDGKKYQVKESRDKFDGRKSKVIGVYSDIKKQREMKEEEKWIQKTGMKKGALHKKLGIPEGDKIPKSKLRKLKSELEAKSKGDKKLSATDLKTLKQVNLALTLGKMNEDKNSLRLTEDELIDMIEQIVLEQKKDNNIDKKSPIGLKKTTKVQDQSKKENEDYAKEVVKKMKDYLKDGSNGEFKESPEDFPKSNYQMKKDEEIVKYNPSDAVEEYIEAFAYPGMTNLVYDEIKPDDEKIEKYLKGDSTTGNATKDKDGKALGNVVPSEVGDRFMKNYKENLYGAEQQEASYKRQEAPVYDVSGPGKVKGSMKKRGDSASKAGKILNQLESTDKKTKVISEEMEKMKNLISYNRKTQ